MKKGVALIELIFAIIVIGFTLMSVPNLLTTTARGSKQVITQESVSSAASHIDMALSLFWDENDTIPAYGNPILAVKSPAPGLQASGAGTGGALGASGASGGMSGVKSPSTPSVPQPAGSAHMPHMPHMPYMPHMPHIKDPKGSHPLPSNDMFNRNLRPGTSLSSSRRFEYDTYGRILTATPKKNLGSDGTESEPDDIDDLNNKSYVLEPHNNNKAVIDVDGDYIDQKIHLATKVQYISDKPTNISGKTTNFNSSNIYYSNPFDSSKLENNSTNVKSITVTLTSDNSKEKVILRAFSCNIGSSKLKEKIF